MSRLRKPPGKGLLFRSEHQLREGANRTEAVLQSSPIDNAFTVQVAEVTISSEDFGAFVLECKLLFRDLVQVGMRPTDEVLKRISKLVQRAIARVQEDFAELSRRSSHGIDESNVFYPDCQPPGSLNDAALQRMRHEAQAIPIAPMSSDATMALTVGGFYFSAWARALAMEMDKEGNCTELRSGTVVRQGVHIVGEHYATSSNTSVIFTGHNMKAKHCEPLKNLRSFAMEMAEHNGDARLPELLQWLKAHFNPSLAQYSRFDIGFGISCKEMCTMLSSTFHPRLMEKAKADFEKVKVYAGIDSSELAEEEDAPVEEETGDGLEQHSDAVKVLRSLVKTPQATVYNLFGLQSSAQFKVKQLAANVLAFDHGDFGTPPGGVATDITGLLVAGRGGHSLSSLSAAEGAHRGDWLPHQRICLPAPPARGHLQL